MFSIIATILFLTGLVIAGYHRYKAETSGPRISWKEEGLLIMVLLRLSGLALWLSVILYLLNPHWMRWASIGLSVWIRWSGVGIMALSLPLLYWLFRSIGTNITPTVAIKQGHQLVTSGPYRWVRHPLYTVGTMTFLGFALIAANWFIGLVTLLVLVLLLVRLPQEETRLIEQFGAEYRAYMKHTGRLLPRLFH